MINIEGKDITQIFYQNKIINHVYYSGEPLQLIEDVDYKTYQWLRLDGYCWIPSGINTAWNQTIEGTMRYDRAEVISTKDLDGGRKGLLHTYCVNFATATALSTSGAYSYIVLARGNNTGTNIYFKNNNLTATSGIEEVYMKQTLYKNRTQYLNSQVCTVKNNGIVIPVTRSVESSWVMPTSFNNFMYRIGNKYNSYNLPSSGYAPTGFASHSVTGIKIGETSFTPVKLLRDIPSFLAYDNKIHRAGESGMINSTTGKFHGKYETGEGGTVLAHNGEVI